MQVFAYDDFGFDLPPEHRFPLEKYRRLRQAVLERGILSPAELFTPLPAARAELELVHTPDYLDQLFSGQVDPRAMRRIGFPWSAELLERARRSVGGTIAACRAALQDGIAASLGGGTHHAYPDHGEGFCLFNDVAVALRQMQQEGRLERAIVIDCDVHQGNGTAFIFAGDPSVFTFSIHGRKNFPFHKETSDLDVALEDGSDDEIYLAALEPALQQSLAFPRPDLAVYLAGADPFREDRFGRMALTKAGLARRDELVFAACRRLELPLALVMSGGYAKDVADIVDIHSETLRQAAESWNAYAAYRRRRNFPDLFA